MEFSTPFHDPALCKALLARLQKSLDAYGQPVRFMEVCGTHTVSIFQSGLRSLLPEGLTHVSGPGCPVCVTADSEVATFLTLAKEPGTILATFGDLIRVPGPKGQSLKNALAEGADVRVVYSPLDALKIAAQNPANQVVFLGVGFETTTPGIAGAVLEAQKQNLDNFMVYACHKRVPPALMALLDNDEGNFKCAIDAFLLPGHVAIILGMEPFSFIPEIYNRPASVSGFEPADILYALCLLVESLAAGNPTLTNAYPRVVAENGNPHARALMERVFRVSDARWRGLGIIPKSGLTLKEEFARFDALTRLGISPAPASPPPGCRCGEMLKGLMEPPACPLFAKTCTPAHPVGPCMVSTEGSCAAWFTYNTPS